MSKLQTLFKFGSSRRTEMASLCGFVILILIVAVIGWVSASKLARFIEIAAQARYYGEVSQRLESVVGDITEAESEQRGYLLTGDAAYLTTYDASTARVREGFAALSALTAEDAKLSPRVREIGALTEKRLGHMSAGIRDHASGDAQQVRDSLSLGRPLSIAIRERFEEVQREYRAHLAEVTDQVSAITSGAAHSFVLALTLAAIVLAFMALIIILEARSSKSLSERLLHDSRHDMLTGLPNYGYTQDWLGSSIAAARRANERVALLYMDLNGFKQVNDAYGHKAGDQVLVDVARNLELVARDSDFIARLGGDEFVVVMPRVTDMSQVKAATQRFSAISVKRGALTVNASVGCAVYPDDADSAEALMQAGDAAMYAHKQARKAA